LQPGDVRVSGRSRRAGKKLKRVDGRRSARIEPAMRLGMAIREREVTGVVMNHVWEVDKGILARIGRVTGHVG